MSSVLILRLALLAATAVFAVFLIKDCIDHKEEFTGAEVKTFVILGAIGLVTDLFDTLGIGCFATSQSAFKFTKTCEDEVMPGTLNVAHCIPVVSEALIFFGLIEVEPLTLVTMIAAAVIGAVAGATIVSKWSVKIVRIALGVALIIVAVIMTLQQISFGPFATSGDAIGLSGTKLVIGLVLNCLLGALMTIGVGLYAPCIALVSSLGMNVSAAFPIMMGSCAFLMPAAGIKFVKEGKYNRKAALMITIFGTVGVLIAAYIITSLPLSTLKWIVIAVMLYTAYTFFRDAKAADVA